MRPNRGLSLLEVMLAIAILGGAVVVIGELVRFASRNAALARDLALAQLLCESKLAELSAGLAAPESTGKTPCETDPDWVYTVDVESTDQVGLVSVRVTVLQAGELSQPVSFSLTRWMVDPNTDAEAKSAAAANSPATTTSSSATPMN